MEYKWERRLRLDRIYFTSHSWFKNNAFPSNNNTLLMRNIIELRPTLFYQIQDKMHKKSKLVIWAARQIIHDFEDKNF